MPPNRSANRISIECCHSDIKMGTSTVSFSLWFRDLALHPGGFEKPYKPLGLGKRAKEEILQAAAADSPDITYISWQECTMYVSYI